MSSNAEGDAFGVAVSDADLESARVELLVGKIGRAHGIRGDVAIEVRTDEPERRFADGTTFDTTRGTLHLASARWHGQRLLATFVGVADRNAAEALSGTELRVDIGVDERPDDPEEFYDHQLIGLTAVTDAGEVVGDVSEVLHLPGQEVLVVRRNGAEVLIPFVSEIVPTVDISASRLVVVLPLGLLDEE
ncbi:MAG: ribosome maturation factor RimM [Nocardioidaceae bacterium]|nr:ribosome maturation factor RimM [Nocardioidaceae bacterium]